MNNNIESPHGIQGVEVRNKHSALVFFLIASLLIPIVVGWLLYKDGQLEKLSHTVESKFGFSQQGMSTKMVTDLVEGVEVYRIDHGSYPDSLDVLIGGRYETLINDPLFAKKDQPTRFYYQKVSDRFYYLLGLGEDRKPFTADDILPKVPFNPEMFIGLIVKVEL